MNKFLCDTDLPIDDVTTITDGRTHDTYAVETTDGHTHFLKYAEEPRPLRKLQHEHGAVTTLTDTDAHEFIPSIIDYNRTPDYGYILYDYYDHTPLTWDDPDTVKTIIDSCATFLSTLHTTPSTTLTERQAWDRYVDQSFTDWLDDFEATTIDLLTGTRYDQYQPLVRGASQQLHKSTPPLKPIHGDFHLPNTRLTPDGHLRRVVDWDRATLGDPTYELAKTEVRIIDLYAAYTPFSRKELISRFRDTYGAAAVDDERLHAYKVIYAIRTTEKMRNRSTFETWQNIDADCSCADRYEDVLPHILDDASLHP